MSSQGAKDFPQGPRGMDIREQRPDAALDVLAAGWTATSTGGAQDPTTENRLHQTCRPVNQFEHVCVEECPLTNEAHSQPQRRQLRRVATELRRDWQPRGRSRGKPDHGKTQRRKPAGTSVARAKQTKHTYIRTSGWPPEQDNEWPTTHERIHTPVNPLRNSA